MYNSFKLFVSLFFLLAPYIGSAYNCSYATELYCGDDKRYAATTTSHFSTNGGGIVGCVSSSWSYNGPDRLFYFQPDHNSTFTVTVSGLTADLDLMVFKSCNGYGNASLSSCVDVSLKSGTSSESVTIDNASGGYYILVDGYASSQKSAFNIKISCSSGGSGYGHGSSCSHATAISCGTTKWVNQSHANNFDRDDYIMTDCGYSSSGYKYDGGDHAFVVDAGSSHSDLKVSVTGLSDDLDLFVFKACSSGSFSSCVGKSINSSKTSEHITIPNASGKYYIVVDGYNAWVKSGFELSVKCEDTYVPPASCSSAKPLKCGDRKWVNAPSTNHFSGTGYDFSNCFNQNTTYGGKDHLYKIELGNHPQDIQIKMSGLTSDMDMFLFKSCQGSYGSDKLKNCEAYSHKSGTSSETITMTGVTGTYYLSIDGYNAWANSGYELSMHCYSAQPEYDCHDATPLTCGTSKWVNKPTSNNLSGYDYDFNGCFSSHLNYKGMDHLYKVDAGSYPTELSIKLKGLSKDMDLFVFKGCNSSYGGINLNSCVDHSFKSGTQDEEVIMHNAIGTYYIAVDAYNIWDVSSYEIEVDCFNQPPDQPCYDATEIKCGDWVSASNSNTDNRSSDRINSHTGCSNGSGYSGREVIFKIKGGYTGLSNIRVDLDPTSHGANFDMFVYKDCVSSYNQYNGDWHYNMSNSMDCSQSSSSGYGESIVIDYIAPNDEVYVVVDTKTGWGTFEISVVCNDLCHHSIRTIECGDTHSTTTSGGRKYAGSYTCDSGENNSGPERMYKLIVEGRTDIRIDLAVGSSADLNLYLLQSCSSTACLDKSSTRGRGKDESITRTLNGGVYYIIVDGYNGDSGDYDLSISGCGCTGAEALWCDTPTENSTANGTSKISELHDECFRTSSYPVELDGPDKIYSFTAPRDGDYRFNLSHLTANLELFLLDDCGDSDACVDFSTKGGNSDETILRTMTKNEEIFVLVDSRKSDWVSTFVLEVECDPDQEEEEEEEEEEEPVDDGLSFSVTKSFGQFTIDLTEAIDETCTNSKLTIQQVDPESGDPVDSTITELDIDDDAMSSYVPTETGVETAYVICFEQLCEDDAIEVACKTVIVDPTLSCGDSYSGTTIGGVSNFDQNDISECYSSSSLFDGPDQLIRFQKTDSNDIIQLTLSHVGGNLSLFVFDENMQPVDGLCKGKNFNATKMLMNGGALGESYNDADNLLPAGTYYALVEGFDRNISADFTLSLACGFWCKGITKIHCGELMAGESNDTDTTYALNSMYFLTPDTAVVAYTGAERVYQLNVTGQQEFTITVDNISAGDDFDLFLLGADCAEGVVMDYSINSGTDAESITVDLETGYYRIVVDGWNGSIGTYDISVSSCEDAGASVLSQAEARSVTSEPLTRLVDMSASVAPNPFAGRANILIDSPIDQDAIISIYAADGTKLLSRSQPLISGSTMVHVDDQDVSVSGLLFFTVETATDIVRGKMIKLR